VADDIETQFDSRRGTLGLYCSDEAFVRVRTAVIAAAGLEQAGIEGIPDGVRTIVVHMQPKRSRIRFSDNVALLGCALVTIVIIFVLSVGVGTIAGWLQ
jgi:hypothetical protein